METKEVKYKYGNNSVFYKTLKSRVNDYFKVQNLTRYANTRMIVKIVITLVMYFGAYILMLSNMLSTPMMVMMAMVMGISLAGIFLNISHDASHFSLSKHTKVNKVLWYSMELIGLNSYIWNYLHNAVHHIYTSIEGEDIIVEEYSILRLSKKQPFQKVHAYQCYYAPFIYSLFSINLIFMMDFTLFKREKMGKSIALKHTAKEYVKLWFFKLFFLGYSLVIPLLIIDVVWWKILIGYYIMHASAGMMFTIVGVLNHQIDESVFPNPDKEGYIHKSKKEHELEVTIDFSPQNQLVSWLFGGFNTHVAHHLFPNICHIHYPAITKIIKNTSQEYDVVYKEQSIGNAIKSHFRYLKRLAHP